MYNIARIYTGTLTVQRFDIEASSFEEALRQASGIVERLRMSDNSSKNFPPRVVEVLREARRKKS